MMENEKIGFFERIKIAVVKLENYNKFLGEKTSVAVKYFFLIVLILAIVMGAVETYGIMKMINKGYSYIQNELPDFSYENGELKFAENIIAHDEEFDLYMITDTEEEVSSEKMQEYEDTIKSNGLIFLKDKVIYRVGNNNQEYEYKKVAEGYNLETLDKNMLIEKINSVGLFGIATTIFLIMTFSLYTVEIVTIFLDWLMITFFAFIVSKICGIFINFKACFNIAIYALTLPIILTGLYNIAYFIFNFSTEYFRVVYLLISYVYIVAVILMIKSDLVKQQIEVAKVVEVQKEVHDELNEQKDEDKKDDKKEEKDSENENTNNDLNGEPDGSEI